MSKWSNPMPTHPEDVVADSNFCCEMDRYLAVATQLAAASISDLQIEDYRAAGRLIALLAFLPEDSVEVINTVAHKLRADLVSTERWDGDKPAFRAALVEFSRTVLGRQIKVSHPKTPSPYPKDTP